MDRMDSYINALDALLDLETEASDPNRIVAGLSVARQMASAEPTAAPEAPELVDVRIYRGSDGVAALTGSYEGGAGVVDGFWTAFRTLAELWNKGEKRIDITIVRYVDDI